MTLTRDELHHLPIFNVESGCKRCGASDPGSFNVNEKMQIINCRECPDACKYSSDSCLLCGKSAFSQMPWSPCPGKVL